VSDESVIEASDAMIETTMSSIKVKAARCKALRVRKSRGCDGAELVRLFITIFLPAILVATPLILSERRSCVEYFFGGILVGGRAEGVRREASLAGRLLLCGVALEPIVYEGGQVE
jgi:hypothetical protein